MWSNVIGQERVKKIVRQALESKKLPNAYFFTGPEGVGKDAVAIELAKAVNCLDPKMNGVEACDACANCNSIGALQSPLLHFVFAIGKEGEEAKQKDDEPNEAIDTIREEITIKASDPYHNIEIPKAINISIGQIRELNLLLSRSVVSGKRIVIISEADTMKPAPQNAFLKTLEEPHSNTLIILTSSRPSLMLPTIASRCQDIRFELLSSAEVEAALIERDHLDKEQAEFLARLSGGSISMARSFASEDVAELRKEVVQFLLKTLGQRRREALAEIDTFLPKRGGAFLKNRQNVEQLLQLLQLWLRDALAMSSGAEDKIFNIDQLEYLKRFTNKFGSPRRIVDAIHSVEEAKRNVFLQLQLRPVMLELVLNLERSLIPE